MKTLFLFPPQWSINGVAGGAAAICGVLKNYGHLCKIINLNVKFYNYIFSEDFINNCFIEIKNSKYTEVSEEYNKNKNEYFRCIKNLNSALNVMRDKKSFYNLRNLQLSLYIIDKVLEFISLAYYPFKINMFNYSLRSSRINYKDYKLYLEDNIFYNFFKSKLDEIRNYNADFIGISIASESQFIAALTLAKLIKENGINANIVFGGPFIIRELDNILNDYDLFNNFIDFAIVGAGEIATLQLLDYLEKKRDITKVSNLVYKCNKKIYQNDISYNTDNLKNLSFNYDDYNKEEYFLPEGVLLLRTADSCYWNKCSFCLHNVGNTYRQRNVNEVIDEIKEIKNKQGVNKFFITDNAINPSFADEFSKKIIEQNIEIYYSCDIRLEKSLNDKLLKQLYNSGLRVCYWGLESANNRILKFLNKGITIENSKRVLELAHDAGIFNFVYFMLGIPTETIEEMNDTVNFMIENNNIIDACLYNEFNILKGSDIYNNPDKYGLKKEDVEIKYNFDICPAPQRKVTIGEIVNAGEKVYASYNHIYNNVFKYGTNELILLYKSKNITLY